MIAAIAEVKHLSLIGIIKRRFLLDFKGLLGYDAPETLVLRTSVFEVQDLLDYYYSLIRCYIHWDIWVSSEHTMKLNSETSG